MAGLLGQVFSAGNVAKRKLTDLLGNPVLSAQQIIGNLNDRARVLNEMTAAAAKEGAMYGPQSQQLAGLLAEAYNPIGMVVYHGSPAKFSRFDPTKIGSGEGAQAYGYGHYVAQSPAVAKEYQSLLSNKSGEILIDGKKLKPKNYEVTQTIARYSDDNETLRSNLSKYIAKSKENPYADIESAQLALDALDAGKSVKPASFGSFYEIDLPDEQIAKMMDWDKPLSQQPKYVQDAIKKTKQFLPQNAMDDLGGDLSLLYGKDVTPNQFLNTWESITGSIGTGEEALRKAGVPGIRYLDQGSRAAPNITNQRLADLYEKHQGNAEAAVDEMMRSVYNTPKKKQEMREAFLKQLETPKTSNFVVFPGNEDLLTILKRNGGLLGP